MFIGNQPDISDYAQNTFQELDNLQKELQNTIQFDYSQFMKSSHKSSKQSQTQKSQLRDQINKNQKNLEEGKKNTLDVSLEQLQQIGLTIKETFKDDPYQNPPQVALDIFMFYNMEQVSQMLDIAYGEVKTKQIIPRLNLQHYDLKDWEFRREPARLLRHIHILSKTESHKIFFGLWENQEVEDFYQVCLKLLFFGSKAQDLDAPLQFVKQMLESQNNKDITLKPDLYMDQIVDLFQGLGYTGSLYLSRDYVPNQISRILENLQPNQDVLIMQLQGLQQALQYQLEYFDRCIRQRANSKRPRREKEVEKQISLSWENIQSLSQREMKIQVQEDKIKSQNISQHLNYILKTLNVVLRDCSINKRHLQGLNKQQSLIILFVLLDIYNGNYSDQLDRQYQLQDIYESLLSVFTQEQYSFIVTQLPLLVYLVSKKSLYKAISILNPICNFSSIDQAQDSRIIQKSKMLFSLLELRLTDNVEQYIANTHNGTYETNTVQYPLYYVQYLIKLIEDSLYKFFEMFVEKHEKEFIDAVLFTKPQLSNEVMKDYILNPTKSRMGQDDNTQIIQETFDVPVSDSYIHNDLTNNQYIVPVSQEHYESPRNTKRPKYQTTQRQNGDPMIYGHQRNSPTKKQKRFTEIHQDVVLSQNSTLVEVVVQSQQQIEEGKGEDSQRNSRQGGQKKKLDNSSGDIRKYFFGGQKAIPVKEDLQSQIKSNVEQLTPVCNTDKLVDINQYNGQQNQSLNQIDTKTIFNGSPQDFNNIITLPKPQDDNKINTYNSDSNNWNNKQQNLEKDSSKNGYFNYKKHQNKRIINKEEQSILYQLQQFQKDQIEINRIGVLLSDNAVNFWEINACIEIIHKLFKIGYAQLDVGSIDPSNKREDIGINNSTLILENWRDLLQKLDKASKKCNYSGSHVVRLTVQNLVCEYQDLLQDTAL